MAEQRWVRALAALVGATAVAVVAFAIAATVTVVRDPDESSAESVRAFPRGPASAILELTDVGRERWRETLGPECDLGEVYAMLIDSDADGYEVISFPGPCEVRRFEIAHEDAKVRPVDLTFPAGQM